MPTDYYLQNRTFDKDRDIECGGDMYAGRDPHFRENYYLYSTSNYSSLTTSETKKSIPIGNVIINSGVKVNLEAKNRVVLEPGFKALNGSRLSVWADATDPNTRSIKEDISVNERIVKERENKYTTSDGEEVAWKLSGYNVNISAVGSYFSIPEYLKKGQYSLSIVKNGRLDWSLNINVNRAQLKEKIEYESFNIDDSRQNLIVAPNPTSGLIKVIATKEIVEYLVVDNFGNQVMKEVLKFERKEFNINLHTQSSGFYLLKVLYNDGFYETKKFIVQD
jgi:hypothetical protein